MKTINLTVLLVLISFFAQAQNNLEEVVYLKNGNVYRGVIVEQIPNESIKIKILGGNVFSVPLTEITKFTKEPKEHLPRPSLDNPTLNNHPNPSNMGAANHPNFTPNNGTNHPRKPFYLKPKGYFGYAETGFGIFYADLRTVHGYKFSPYAYLGVGTGIDFFVYLQNKGMAGIQIPLFVRFESDFLKRKVTPYIETELGWGFNLAYSNINNNGNYYSGSDATSTGGPMGAVGVGVKIFTNSRFNLKVTPMFTWKVAREENQYSYFDDQTGQSYSYTDKRNVFGGTFGVKVGFGF